MPLNSISGFGDGCEVYSYQQRIGMPHASLNIETLGDYCLRRCELPPIGYDVDHRLLTGLPCPRCVKHQSRYLSKSVARSSVPIGDEVHSYRIRLFGDHGVGISLLATKVCWIMVSYTTLGSNKPIVLSGLLRRGLPSRLHENEADEDYR